MLLLLDFSLELLNASVTFGQRFVVSQLFSLYGAAHLRGQAGDFGVFFTQLNVLGTKLVLVVLLYLQRFILKLCLLLLAQFGDTAVEFLRKLYVFHLANDCCVVGFVYAKYSSTIGALQFFHSSTINDNIYEFGEIIDR